MVHTDHIFSVHSAVGGQWVVSMSYLLWIVLQLTWESSDLFKILISVTLETFLSIDADTDTDTCCACSVMSDSLWTHRLSPARFLYMGFIRQEYWSGLPFPTPRHLSDPGIKPCLLFLLHWQVNSLPLAPLWKPVYLIILN